MTLLLLGGHGVRVLNVAGPRESIRPGTYREVAEVLRAVLGGASGQASGKGSA